MAASAIAVPLFTMVGAMVVFGADRETLTAEPAGAVVSESGGKLRDPENVRGISPAMESCLSGIQHYLSKDYLGALDWFKKAEGQNGHLAFVPYFEGEASIALDKLEDADRYFTQAVQLADGRDAEMRTRALFALADIKERRHKADEALTAWKAFADYSASRGDAGAAKLNLSAQARISYLTDFVKLEKAYEGVRERIRTEKADGGREAGK